MYLAAFVGCGLLFLAEPAEPIYPRARFDQRLINTGALGVILGGRLVTCCSMICRLGSRSLKSAADLGWRNELPRWINGVCWRSFYLLVSTMNRLSVWAI